jgi:hypothetical protein
MTEKTKAPVAKKKPVIKKAVPATDNSVGKWKAKLIEELIAEEETVKVEVKKESTTLLTFINKIVDSIKAFIAKIKAKI